MKTDVKLRQLYGDEIGALSDLFSPVVERDLEKRQINREIKTKTKQNFSVFLKTDRHSCKCWLLVAA